MAIEDTRMRADALLTQTQTANIATQSIPVTATSSVALAAPPIAPTSIFSPFIPQQMEQAIQLAAQLMEIADTATTPDDLSLVIAEAEKARATYGLDLIKYALMIFMTHHPLGKQFSIPPIETRAPEKLLPSSPSTSVALVTTAATATTDGALDISTLDPEAPLAWYREDPKANEHHEHWHVVYPHAGVRINTQAPPVLKDRQDELFLYMHQQMLARYDTERLALDMARVIALSDYTAPIPEGYDPGPNVQSAQGTPYVARPAGMQLSDLQEHSLADFATQRDRLRAAIDSGFLTQNGAQVPITVDLLGATIEASIGSVSFAESKGQLLQSFYGNQHNYGHVFLGFITDPINEAQAGVILDTATAIRDPVFYRWHKHIDDFSFRWQEKQAPNNFSDAPPVLIRKSLNATTSSQSPDIILACRDDGSGNGPVIPGSSDPNFAGQSYGQQQFGGANWNTDFSASATTTNELHTRMLQRNITTGTGNTVTINYLDQDKEFFYFLRVENQAAQPTDVTVRIFLVAQQEADDRRMWIEMDKFHYTLPASQQTVIFRPASLSAVIRKPAVRPPAPVTSSHATGNPSIDAEDMNNYCDCGWPYNLLLPRGTQNGMAFRLLVMLTDWNIDHVAEDTSCGSMSYCGAKDKYPDSRSMGYPFDRPFAIGTSIAQTVAAQNNMATRDITIRWLA
ncbi:MAG: hypothetical protein NVS4B11_31750 [Ktedonobacteraceae bacterium]